MSRREFMRLIGLAAAVGATGLPLSLSACGHVVNPNRPVRREITTVDNATITKLKTAITWMQGLPSTGPSLDRRSWAYQASIHANFCQHANWLFFPWHRAYLYYFEQICRVGCGDPNFALPYWNWTLHPQIPTIFWDTASPLYHSPRGDWLTPSSTAPDFAVSSMVMNDLFMDTNFFTFAGDSSSAGTGHADAAGSIEATPHNNVHGWVGGDMGYVPSAAQDPLFWMHHNMVEQVWVQWNIVQGKFNTNLSAWLNATLSGFVDGTGASVSVRVIDTLAWPFTAYRFDTQP